MRPSECPRGKRVFDVVGVLVVAPVALPASALVAVAIWLSEGRPVLYRQQRCGRYGRPFQLLKFRSMRPGAGRGITSADDPRIFRIGQILRRTKLDELPQLWNVLAGEMSLVGPRPEVPEWVARFPEDFVLVHAARPGLTDLGSVHYRDEADVIQGLVEAGAADSVDDAYGRLILPHKLALGAAYAANQRMSTDLLILVATLAAVLLRRVPPRLLRRVSIRVSVPAPLFDRPPWATARETVSVRPLRTAAA